jgi:outer membrane biosynthesis protein TonB
MADDPIKSRLAMSVGLHIAVLVGSTVAFVAKPYSTPPAEALPIDIISATEFSQYMAGSKNAKPAPTAKPLAEKVGDPKPVDDPAPKVTEKQEIKMASADPQQPVPPVKPEQKAEKKPDPKPEKKPDAQKQPDAKPDPIAEALKKDDTKKPEKKVEEKKAEVKPPPQPPKKPAKEYKYDASQMAALLDKREAQRHAATGAELNATASLGLSHANAMSLSQSELDALRAQIQACWSLPAGAQDVKDIVVQVQISLRQDGSLAADPIPLNRGTGAFQVVAESALRAVRRCAPYRLPAAKYDVWKEVEINFDPRQMFAGG